MRIRDLNRWQATAGHLTFSLLLGLAVFALFRFLWYPGALFSLAGAGKLMLLVVGIDVILGPLLTLIVFNPKKKSLIWDLAVIVAVQLGALGYGVWVMAQSRPVFLVGVVDRFELVAANEIHPDELAKASKPEWRTLSWTGPIIVGAKAASNPDERMAQAMDAMRGGPDLPQLPKYFVPISDVSERLISESRSLSEFEPIAPKDVTHLRAWLHDRSIDESTVAVLPLKARLGMGAMMIDRETASPLTTATFDGYAQLGSPDGNDEDAPPETE
jgi:hypothetical protein